MRKTKREKRSTVSRKTAPRRIADQDLRGASGAGDPMPTETVGLNYGHIEWTYTQQKRPDGAGGGNVTAKYDLVKAKGA